MRPVRRLLESLRDLTEADEGLRTLERSVLDNPHDGALQQRLIAALRRGGLGEQEARAQAGLFYITRAGIHPDEDDHRSAPAPKPSSGDPETGEPDDGWGRLSKKNLAWEGPTSLIRPWAEGLKNELQHVVDRGDTQALGKLGFVKDSHGAPSIAAGARYTRDVRSKVVGVKYPEGKRSPQVAFVFRNSEGPGGHYRQIGVVLTKAGVILHYLDLLEHPPATGQHPSEDDSEVVEVSTYRLKGVRS